MFQTELIIFLQSFESVFLTSAFHFFTEIGRTTYALPLLFIVMFGISYRAGFILIHVVSWNGFLSLGLKELFSLPRPANVDANIKLLVEKLPNPSPMTSMGAESFFGRLPSEAVELFRLNPFDSWGFPSGHASQAVSLWGSLFLYFRKVWLGCLSVTMIIFISLSRMYLGRHFLADILGGLLLGALCTSFFYRKVFLNERLTSALAEKLNGLRSTAKIVIGFFYFIVAPLLVLLIPNIPPKTSAAFLGLNIGFLLIWKRGIPSDSGRIQERAARVLIAGITFLLSYFLFERGFRLLFSTEPVAVEFIRLTLSMILFLWGATEACIKLRLFKSDISDS